MCSAPRHHHVGGGKRLDREDRSFATYCVVEPLITPLCPRFCQDSIAGASLLACRNFVIGSRLVQQGKQLLEHPIGRQGPCVDRL